jgi:hypothetical protein
MMVYRLPAIYVVDLLLILLSLVVAITSVLSASWIVLLTLVHVALFVALIQEESSIIPPNYSPKNEELLGMKKTGKTTQMHSK